MINTNLCTLFISLVIHYFQPMTKHVKDETIMGGQGINPLSEWNLYESKENDSDFHYKYDY